MKPKAQASKILAHLKCGFSITAMDALKWFGCFRLGARIYDLKRAGNLITTRMVKVNGKHIAEYRLIP